MLLWLRVLLDHVLRRRVRGLTPQPAAAAVSHEDTPGAETARLRAGHVRPGHGRGLSPVMSASAMALGGGGHVCERRDRHPRTRPARRDDASAQDESLAHQRWCTSAAI